MGSHNEILVIEEDEATRTFIADQLSADGYEILTAESRRHALQLLSTRRPHLVLADINGETLGLLDAIRTGEGVAARVDPDTPMIVLTSRTDELTRVRVFEHDGDDVLAKPFSYAELRGRIRAVLRRSYGHRHRQVARVGTLRVDLASREVHVDGRPVALSAKEFELLRALVSDPTRVFTRDELIRGVWRYSPAAAPRSRTLDSHAARLRQKLKAAGADRPLVINVWGVGLRLCNHAATEVAA
jgi:DNA-binding response OmpR family regulator